jgi:hypothetical protein
MFFDVRTPLLIQEGWREAPGWSVWDQHDSSLTSPPFGHPSCTRRGVFSLDSSLSPPVRRR